MPEREPNGSRPSTEQLALRDAQRSMDNAVHSIFELAHRLESLREAIARAKTEALSELQLSQLFVLGSSRPLGTEADDFPGQDGREIVR